MIHKYIQIYDDSILLYSEVLLSVREWNGLNSSNSGVQLVN